MNHFRKPMALTIAVVAIMGCIVLYPLVSRGQDDKPEDKEQNMPAATPTSKPIEPVQRPALARLAPAFLVADTGKSVAFYRDKLGFEIDVDESPDFAILSRDDVQIFLKRAADPAAIVHNRERVQGGKFYDAYLFTRRLEDVDAIFAELREKGVDVQRSDWGPGMYEISILDPDGYQLIIAHSKR